jgi:hypothetical protein
MRLQSKNIEICQKTTLCRCLYSCRIFELSLLISVITAALVFIALQLIIVRPIGQLTESMVQFQRRP